MQHDAFISYSTVATGALGAAVEATLTTFGRPWGQPFAMRVFRDVSDQPATPDLSAELLAHLDASTWLILLASPAAAQSKWVQQEIAHWLKAKSLDRLLLCIAAGDIEWDPVAQRFDPVRTTCLPAQILDAVTAVPKWVDFRGAEDRALDTASNEFRDKVADLSATIRGISKARLISQHWAAHRKSVAHRTAQHAMLAVNTDPWRALLLTAAAVELDDVPETRLALSTMLESWGAATSIEGPLGRVSSFDVLDDSDSVILGHANGSIDIYTVSRGTHSAETPLRMGVPPTTMRAARGGVAIGYDDGQVLLLSKSGVKSVRVADAPITLVVPDASLRYLGFATTTRAGIWDTSDDQMFLLNRDLISVSALGWKAESLIVCDWSTMARIHAVTREVETVGAVPFLPRPGPRAFGRELDQVAVAQLDGGGITLYPLPDSAGGSIPFVQGPPGFIDAMALSASGNTVAVAANGRLKVWSFRDPQRPIMEHVGLPATTKTLAVSENGSWVLVQSDDRCEVRSASNSALRRSVPLPALELPSAIQGVIAVTFSPDSDLICWISDPSGHRRDSISTWSTSQETFGASLQLPGKIPVGLSFESPEVVVVECHGGELIRWQLGDETLSRREPTTTPTPAAPTVSIDWEARRIQFSDDDAAIDEVTWTGNEGVEVVVSPSKRLAAIAFRQSGRLLLRDLEARMDRWLVATAQYSAIACSYDDQVVAGVTSAGDIHLIDAASGQVFGRISSPPAVRHRLAFAPSGRQLACAVSGGGVDLIDIDPHSWITTARSRAGRHLSQAELEEFGLDRLLVP
jgi:WD40 repeat protein